METKPQLVYNLRPRATNDADSSDENSSSDEDYDPKNDGNEISDDQIFHKFLHKMFPSKNLKEKIKEMDAITKQMDKEERKVPKVNRRKKKITPINEEIETDISSSESEEESETECETESESDEEEVEKPIINIVLNINDLEQDVSETDESESESEDEDESTVKKGCVKIDNIDHEKDLLKQIEESLGVLGKDNENTHIFKEFKKFSNEQNEIMEKHQKKTTKKTNKKNIKDFRSLINERKTNNEVAYFSKLDVSEQDAIIQKFRDANKLTKLVKPYRFRLIDMDLPDHIKSIALKKMSTFSKMEPDSSEYFKMKNWIDAFMSIPFNVYKNFDISLQNDGHEKCCSFMSETSKIMDNAVYGLNDAKMQIMQMIGTWISNPSAVGNAIAIKGPPGTGKTTLVKEGVSKVLNRPFSFIALGGSTDSSFLEGHSYTYEGSVWGKIVSILMESKCMNPVIYFDELDKVSDTPKGEEIIGILTHLIDTSQNSEFHDKYFSDIKFDLSKCLFIFSYNDESKINPILKDRMYKIETKGYNAKEKSIIARQHLLPSIQEQIGISDDDLIIPDEVLSYLIKNHTSQEKGVRTLKRCLEMIYTKMNLSRFTDLTLDIFKDAFVENITFPYTITNRDVDKLVVKSEQNPYLTTLYT